MNYRENDLEYLIKADYSDERIEYGYMNDIFRGSAWLYHEVLHANKTDRPHFFNVIAHAGFTVDNDELITNKNGKKVRQIITYKRDYGQALGVLTLVVTLSGQAATFFPDLRMDIIVPDGRKWCITGHYYNFISHREPENSWLYGLTRDWPRFMEYRKLMLEHLLPKIRARLTDNKKLLEQFISQTAQKLGISQYHIAHGQDHRVQLKIENHRCINITLTEYQLKEEPLSALPEIIATLRDGFNSIGNLSISVRKK